LQLALYRPYDAELGRWITRDPLGFIDGPNVYRYSHNTPIVRYDPLGLRPVIIPIPIYPTTCASMNINAADNVNGGDKLRHCVVTCEITRNCGRAMAYLAGIAKEIIDIAGPGDADWDDWTADLVGICAATWRDPRGQRGTCEDRCREVFR
jgi:hypothetical protein